MDNNVENQNVQPVAPETPMQPVEPIQTSAAPETPMQPVEPIAPVQPEVQPVAPMEPMMQAPMTPPPVSPVEPEAKKKKSIVPIVILILFIVLAAAGAAVYFIFFGKVTGKQVVDAAINKVFSKAETVGNKLQDYVVIDYKKDIVHQSGDLVLNADIKSGSETMSFKDVKISYDTKINLKDLEGSFKVGTSQNGKEIANVEAFLQKKVLYANSNLFANPYKADMSSLDWNEVEEYIKNMPDYNSQSYVTLINKTKTIFKNAIKEDYITQTEGNFTIEGVEVSGLKNSLVIDEATFKSISTDILTSIKNDSEYIEILATYTGQSKEDIIKSIEEELDEIKDTKIDAKNNVTLSIYTSKKGKFLAMEVTSADTSLTAVSENDVTTFRYKEKNKETYKFTYDEKEKEFTFNLQDGYTLKVKFIDNGMKFTVEGNGLYIDLSFTSVNENSSIKGTLESNLKYTESSTNIKGSLKFNTELNKVDKISTFSTSNAKNFDEMTSEEYEAIMTKLQSAVKGTYLETILALTTTTSSTPVVYDDVYDFDY